jgi:hypothetical protein
MSTTSMEETQTTAATLALPAEAPAGAAPSVPTPTDPDVRTFRGRTLEELIPQIREQLGPDAVVVRQRDGLMGGIGGFFQQRFVEVEAKSGPTRPGPRIDVYDEEPPPSPESFAALLADAESDTDPVVTAAAFVLGGRDGSDSQPPALPEPAAEAGGPRIAVAPTDSDSRSSTDSAQTIAEPPTGEVPPASEPVAQTVAAPPAAELPPASELGPLAAQATAALTLTAELTQTGMSASFAERLAQDAEAHELPFTHGDQRAAVRRALARRIPTSLPHRAGGLAVAFAGPGSTACASALAAAYKRAGRDGRAVATLDRAQARIERAAADAVLALDLPPIPSDRAELIALAERVAQLELDEVLMVLPADLDLPSARALHERMAPFAPTGIALDATHAAPLGAALELACTTRLPLAYVYAAAAIVPADPATLAERLLP